MGHNLANSRNGESGSKISKWAYLRPPSLSWQSGPLKEKWDAKSVTKDLVYALLEFRTPAKHNLWRITEGIRPLWFLTLQIEYPPSPQIEDWNYSFYTFNCCCCCCWIQHKLCKNCGPKAIIRKCHRNNQSIQNLYDSWEAVAQTLIPNLQ